MHRSSASKLRMVTLSILFFFGVVAFPCENQIKDQPRESGAKTLFTRTSCDSYIPRSKISLLEVMRSINKFKHSNGFYGAYSKC